MDYENPLVSLNFWPKIRAGYFLGVNVALGGCPWIAMIIRPYFLRGGRLTLE